MLAALCLVFAACNGEEKGGDTPPQPEIVPGITIQESAVVYPAASKHATVIPFTVERLEEDGTVEVSCPQSVKAECSVDAEGNGTLSVTVVSDFERTVDVQLTASNGVKKAQGNVALVLAYLAVDTGETSLNAFPAKGGEFTVNVRTNVEFAASTTSEWIALNKTEGTVTVAVLQNTVKEERSAEITFTDGLGLLTKTLTLVQGAAPEDELALMKIIYQKFGKTFDETKKIEDYDDVRKVDGEYHFVSCGAGNVYPKDYWQVYCADMGWYPLENIDPVVNPDFYAFAQEQIEYYKQFYAENGIDYMEIPEEIGKLKYLTSLDIRHCPAIIGEIPEWIRGLKYLKSLKLSQNNMTGNIPAWLAELPLEVSGWNWVSLYGNRFSGKVPDVILNCSWWSDDNLVQQEGYGLWK